MGEGFVFVELGSRVAASRVCCGILLLARSLLIMSATFRLDRVTTATTSTNMKSITSKSSTTRVSPPHSPSPTLSYQRTLTEICNSDTKEEDLTHPEDIAHFRKHDEMDVAAEYQERIDAMPIVEQNIPQKFRRH